MDNLDHDALDSSLLFYYVRSEELPLRISASITVFFCGIGVAGGVSASISSYFLFGVAGLPCSCIPLCAGD